MMQEVEDWQLHSVMVATVEEARLHFLSPVTGVAEVITIPAFSFIIFHGRLRHAGAVYSDRNTRLHFYVSAPLYL
jgi:hypothetical protein